MASNISKPTFRSKVSLWDYGLLTNLARPWYQMQPWLAKPAAVSHRSVRLSTRLTRTSQFNIGSRSLMSSLHILIHLAHSILQSATSRFLSFDPQSSSFVIFLQVRLLI